MKNTPEPASLTERFQALQHIAAQLIVSSDGKELLRLIVDKAMTLLKCDGGSLYLVKDSENLLFSVALNRSVPIKIREFMVPIHGKGIAAYAFRTGTAVSVEDVYRIPHDSPFHFDTVFDERMGYRTRSIIAIPLTSSKGEKLGVLQLINRKWDENAHWESQNLSALNEMPSFDEQDEQLLRSFAALASASIEKNRLYENIEKLFEGFIRASVKVIESRDPATKGHSERVATLTVALAQELGKRSDRSLLPSPFTHRQLQEIYYASLLHDFGKVSVSEKVLLKANKLYPEELQKIRARFDRLACEAERDLLWGALRRHRDSGQSVEAAELEALEGEIQGRCGAIERHWENLLLANRPNILDMEAAEGLKLLRKLEMRDSSGSPRPVIEEKEFLALAIKRGSLSEAERREIENHVTSTYLFLKEIPWTPEYASIPEIAYCHHEKLDGSGYPRGLPADRIPLPSRIMTICDIYDALVAADRPYKKALPVDRALEILEDEAKRGKLDERLFRIFVEARIFELTKPVPKDEAPKAA